MLFNVYDQNNKLIGQVEGDTLSEARHYAYRFYESEHFPRRVLDVKPVESIPELKEIKGNGGGERLEHWLTTGKYLYKGVEYADVPHQLEVDTGRGVLYLHNLLMEGQTVLRVCRIPGDVLQVFAGGIGTVSIHLKTTATGRGIPRGKIIKKQPVFLNIPGSFPEVGGEFSIVNEAGQIFFEFGDVPGELMKALWRGDFADITLGYTGVK